MALATITTLHCSSSYLDLLQFLLELFVLIGLVLYEQGDHCPCPLQARSCLLMGHLFNVLTINLRGETAKEEKEEGGREREGGRGRRREEGEGERERGRRREEEEKEGGGEGFKFCCQEGEVLRTVLAA